MALFNENKFKVRKLDKIADKIEALAPKYSAMDDDTLASQTDVLKKRLENVPKDPILFQQGLAERQLFGGVDA